MSEIENEEKELPYLTSSQKAFCRLYIQYEENHSKAAQEIYGHHQNYLNYALRLLRNPKAQHFIEYLRQDAYENVLDKDGRQALTVGARAREYRELIEEARENGEFGAAASLKRNLDNLIGRKKRHGFNLNHCKNVDEKKQTLYSAIAEGDIDDYEFTAMNKAVDNESQSGSVSNPVRVAIMPDNSRVNNNDKK